MALFEPPPPTGKNYLSLGAGVQSSTLALMAAKGEIGPMPDAALFADTEAEPQAVYEWLDWLENQLPFPVIRVTNGSLEENELTLRISKKSGKTYRRTFIPAFAANPDGTTGIVARKCTADFKVRPLTKKVREIAGIARGQKQITVTQWLGISYDELQRMKHSQEKWCQHRWPLIELRMTRRDCLDWMQKNGFPTPPRSACTFCPFHSDHEWRKLRDDDPEGWSHAIDFEKRMQQAAKQDQALRAIPFLHRSLKPLGEVDLTTDIERGQGILWDMQAECEGLCGV